jgi:hypothetical protein
LVQIDPDRDPVFAGGIPMTNGYAFLSFLGEVHEVDLSGAKPVFRAPWSLLGAADKSAHWRPGGMQIGAIHRQLNRLYVPMHQGGEGTQQRRPLGNEIGHLCDLWRHSSDPDNVMTVRRGGTEDRLTRDQALLIRTSRFTRVQ